MQQIAKFDQELNYVPYRYRNRSTTNPKKAAGYSGAYSYSRGKAERHNPEKTTWNDHIPTQGLEPVTIKGSLRDDLQRLKLMLDVKGQYQQKQEDEEPSDEWEYHSQHISQHKNLQNEHFEDHTIEQAESPIKRLQISHKLFPPESKDVLKDVQTEKNAQNEVINGEAEKGEENQKINPAQTKTSAIFNQFDVQEIKNIILQNIRHSQSQNQLKQQTSQIVLQDKISQQSENINFPFEKLQFIVYQEQSPNQKYEELQNYQFNRNLKRREVIKKAKKMKPQNLKKKLQFLDNPNPVISLSSVEIVPKPKQASLLATQVEKEKDQTFNNHSNSINTTNSSHQRIKEEQTKSNQVLTFEKYKKIAKEKQSSQNESNFFNPVSIKGKDESHSYSHFMRNKTQKVPEIKEPQKIKANLQKEESQNPMPNLLAQFTRNTPNESIKLLKEAKSKEKPSESSLSPQQSQAFNYAYKQTSSYKGKQASNNQSYGYNMKKRKQKSTTIANHKVPQKSENNESSLSIKQHLEKIQEQASSINDHESLKSSHQHYQLNQEPQQNKPEVHAELSDIHHVYQPNQVYLAQSASSQRVQGLLAWPDMEELQIGICQCLKSEKADGTERQEPNKTNRTHQHQSHPTSKVYQRHCGEELKSDDGEELLKIMGINSNFKQLSSLVFEDRSPQHNDLSLASQELCEIINSNQSEFSATPTPQGVSLSSSSIHYNFEDSEGDEGLRRAIEGSRQETVRDESALIQINEDSNVFPNPLILPVQMPQNIFSRPISRIELNGIKSSANLPSQGHPSSRRSTQAQADQNSIREYRNHFNPSQAIRKFKHAKHNSADFKEKSLQSARINHSLSTLRYSKLTMEYADRVRSRLEKNKTRFQTTLNPGRH